MENLDNEVGGSRKNIDFDIASSNVDIDLEGNCGFATGIYNPQVADDLRPRKGQEFLKLDDVAAFYKAYAKEAGFSVRSWSSKKNKEGTEIMRKEFVCSKQGKYLKSAGVGKKRHRGSFAEGCNAKLAVLRSNSDSFKVSVFVEGHSHPLSTSGKSHPLRSTQQLSMANVTPHQQSSFLEVQTGGIENVGCTQRDFYNDERDKLTDMKRHDGDIFFEYLKFEREKNRSFTFKIEADDEDNITRCFWSDATSRHAYKFYGDVLIFDITYNTNRYGLIFATIMGVNNHGKTIVFACAFLNKESIDSFVWLFNQFLKSMSGSAPKMIITDQHPAMTKAISIVLPNTFHGYSSWHILMKFSEKIDATKYSIYYKEFSACIWNSESPEEFDSEWESLIERSGLQGNTWLQEMYDLRSRWIPAYVNHNFSAGMLSSQQAESGYAFFKEFVSMNNSLVDFVVWFDRGLVCLRNEELIANHKDTNEKPKIRINHNFLAQMADIYTHEMFYKFQDELCESFRYKFQFVRESDNHRVYQIQKRNVETSKVREILYEKDLDFASCSCKKFASTGILCRHIHAYLAKFHDLGMMPDKYILKRWTKSTKSRKVINDYGLCIVEDTSFMLKRSQLIQSTLDVVDKAFVCEETRKIYIDGLRSVTEQIDQFISNRPIEWVSSEKSNPLGGCATSSHASCSFENNHNEPSQVGAKMCEKKLKGGKKKVLNSAKNQKVRRCHGCGKIGQAHDKRNCPAILNQPAPCNKDGNLGEDNGPSTEDEDEVSLN
ncbi:hypothetical protein LguiB_017825 [Lonicera macranthoides]